MTETVSSPAKPKTSPDGPGLRRSLSLTLLTLYGLGVTIGAGIFVLIGKIAGVAGIYAPLAFLGAALLAGLTALSFAELSARFPESAGEAAYVREGLRSRKLARIVGLMVAGVGIVSSAAIVIGFIGYLSALIALNETLSTVLAVALVGGIAAIGIAPSVLIAAVFSVAEIGILVAVVIAGVYGGGVEVFVPPAPVLPPDGAAMLGIASGAVLAFFAFIGFEDIVNVAEETRDAQRNVPRAIFLTLIITVVLYVAVALVAGAVVPPAELAESAAPLVLVFERASGLSGQPLAAVAVLAVLNGALIQTIMASRVFYGMARRNMLPAVLARVSPKTHTPLVATAVVTASLLLLALTFPIETLAQATSFIALTIFALINVSLIALRMREDFRTCARLPGHIRIPLILPALGCIVCVCLLAFQTWSMAFDTTLP